MKKVVKDRRMYFLCLSIFLLVLFFVTPVHVHASNWIDEISKDTGVIPNYSKYNIFNYSLDYYVPEGSDWTNFLPWNWGEGVQAGIMYGFYLLTNVIWMVSVMISYVCGMLLEQAYRFDFVDKVSEVIADSMQSLAGVNKTGFTGTGLFSASAMLLIFIMGIYLLWVGVLKHQLSRATGQIFKFVCLFVFGMGFIAFSADYIKQINLFQSEINNEVMNTTSKMSNNRLVKNKAFTETDDPVVNLRQTIFDIQVKKPYLLLQYGDTDIPDSRSDKILKFNPFSLVSDNGEDSELKQRENAVKQEVEVEGKFNNDNMSAGKVMLRFIMAVLVAVVNIVISICIGIFAGVLLFSQLLFLIFIYLSPLAIILGLIPEQGKIAVSIFSKAFNAIMTRVGLTVLLSIIFSFSSLVYTLTDDYSYVWSAFLQLVIYGGSIFKMSDFLSLLHLTPNGAKSMTREVGRVGKTTSRMINQYMLGRTLGNSVEKIKQKVNEKKQGDDMKKSTPKVTVGKEKTRTSKEKNMDVGNDFRNKGEVNSKSRNLYQEKRVNSGKLKNEMAVKSLGNARFKNISQKSQDMAQNAKSKFVVGIMNQGGKNVSSESGSKDSKKSLEKGQRQRVHYLKRENNFMEKRKRRIGVENIKDIRSVSRERQRKVRRFDSKNFTRRSNDKGRRLNK